MSSSPSLGSTPTSSGGNSNSGYKTCGKNSGFSPKIVQVLEYKIAEIDRIYEGQVVNIVILDEKKDILYHSGLSEQKHKRTNSTTPESSGSDAEFFSDTASNSSAGTPVLHHSTNSMDNYIERTVFRAKRKSQKNVERPQIQMTTQELQTSINSFIQSASTFVHLFAKEDDKLSNVHVKGTNHLLSYYDNSEIALAFYTKLKPDQIENIDMVKIDKSMKQVLEDLRLILRNIFKN